MNDQEPLELGFASALRADGSLYRWALILGRFSDCVDDQPFAVVMTDDGGTARLTYGDARAMLRDLLDAREQLDRILSWHARETGPHGTVGDYCTECGQPWPCDTRRMADGTHEDLTAVGTPGGGQLTWGERSHG